MRRCCSRSREAAACDSRRRRGSCVRPGDGPRPRGPGFGRCQPSPASSRPGSRPWSCQTAARPCASARFCSRQVRLSFRTAAISRSCASSYQVAPARLRRAPGGRRPAARPARWPARRCGSEPPLSTGPRMPPGRSGGGRRSRGATVRRPDRLRRRRPDRCGVVAAERGAGVAQGVEVGRFDGFFIGWQRRHSRWQTTCSWTGST